VLELWRSPKLMNVALYFKEGATTLVRDKRMIPVDYSSPLLQMIPAIQRTFALDQEFSFQYAEHIDDSGGVVNRMCRVVVLVHANKSLILLAQLVQHTLLLSY
jgi:hypothetical protein